MWIYEAGIGEARAALIEDGAIVEARIDRNDARPRFGDVLAGRLRRKAGTGGRGEVELTTGGHVVLFPVPSALAEGAALLVEIFREAIPERRNHKLPLARPSDASGPIAAPALLDALLASGVPVRILRAHEPDTLETAGWSELIEQAETGLVPFPGGLLRIDLTAAMTMIDVDGDLAPAELAYRGASAAGAAIRRFGIAGSIGIDLPTTPSKAVRQAAAEALDATLPQPFERTAVNGFGFLQVVRRRVLPSLLELIQSDPARAQALALLRGIEREPPSGTTTIFASLPIVSRLERHPEWLDDLARRRGSHVHIMSK